MGIQVSWHCAKNVVLTPTLSGGGNGNPLQYSGLENSMDCIIHGVARSQTGLGDFHFHFNSPDPSLPLPHCLYCCNFHSVQFSLSVMSNSLQPHESQHARPPCPSPTPRVYPNSCPSSQWWHPATSSSVIPFSPAPNPSQHQGLSQWVNSLHQVAKVLEFQLQHQSFQWTPRTDLL